MAPEYGEPKNVAAPGAGVSAQLLLAQQLDALTFQAANYDGEEDGDPMNTPQVLLGIFKRSLGFPEAKVVPSEARSTAVLADPTPVIKGGLLLAYHWSLPPVSLALLVLFVVSLVRPTGKGLPVGLWQAQRLGMSPDALVQGVLGSLLGMALVQLSQSWQIQRVVLGRGEVKSGLYYHPSERNERIVGACPALEPGSYERRQTPWLWNGDFTTFVPFLVNRSPVISYERRWIRAEDGERIATDWIFPESGFQADKPVVLMLHGLNGGSDEAYILDMVPQLLARGWTCVVMINRGLMNTPVEKHCFHGARLSDVHATVRVLQKTVGAMGAPICAVGFSMGGVILPNYCGFYGAEENRREASGEVPPFGLEAAVCLSGCIDCVKNSKFDYSRRVWQPFLAYQLKETFVGRFAHIFRARGLDPQRICRRDVVDIPDFDAQTIVPLFGFRDVTDYYEHMSVAFHDRLRTISKPLLMFSARDDPIIDCDSFVPGIAAIRKGQENLVFGITKTGGHVGFPIGWWPAPNRWRVMNEVTMQFIEAALNERGGK